nr:thioredoxin family protein [uncultured Flavobacterium sp.]
MVDIGSKYCATCKTVKPILESLRTQYGEKLKIIEIELEESPQVIADLKNVKVFPTLIFYQNGKIVFKKDGLGNLKNDVDVALAK